MQFIKLFEIITLPLSTRWTSFLHKFSLETAPLSNKRKPYFAHSFSNSPFNFWIFVWETLVLWIILEIKIVAILWLRQRRAMFIIPLAISFTLMFARLFSKSLVPTCMSAASYWCSSNIHVLLLLLSLYFLLTFI